MRKTLFAMMGLVALGLWALPALAAVSNDPLKDPPPAAEPILLENRAGLTHPMDSRVGSLSGTIINQAQVATTTWFLYPGACVDRANGTWAGRPTPQADSLNTYTTGTIGPYGVADQSLAEILWHVDDNGLCTSGTNCPPALGGTRSLWCGKFDLNYLAGNHYGYPNLTYQILYVDTGAHLGPTYNFSFDYNFSSEFNYDFTRIVGGGNAQAVDPIGNSRATLDNIIAAGGFLVEFTGSIRPTSPNAGGGNTTLGAVLVHDNPGSPLTVTGASFTIDSSNRALYIVFKSDCLYSTEDGNWPEGHGQIMDNLATSDNGPIYTDQTPAGGKDAVQGDVIVGTPSAPIVSARVAPGIGTLWQLVAGNNLPTADICSPQKAVITDIQFEGGNAATFHTVPNQFNSVVTCTFPIPAGTANVTAFWNEYLDLPINQGYVQYADYRAFQGGAWTAWLNSNGSSSVTTGALQAWVAAGNELPQATNADSVQIRYNIQCITFFAADHNNCGDVTYGVLYDDFRLQIVTGVPAPVMGVFVGAIAQSTFIDGTMAGLNCLPATVAAGQCWPGVRGSDITAPIGQSSGAVKDNFNSPLGDSIAVHFLTGLRKNGKGINWQHGFDKSVNFGLSIAHTNPNFVAAFDNPRIIYRLFDPATKTWSPFDSSEMDANNVAIAAGDTALVESGFRMNWPPRDKQGTSLPGGFSINGKTAYNQLAFLPRGTRVQYYLKAVDIGGGTTYQFSSDALAREVLDLPTLPGSTIKAPDIIEFDVLPGVYAPGAAGTQLANRTNTPLLELDGSYTRWNFATHATVQALRAMGVRADRYRALQGVQEGGHIGGHEFLGTRAGRLSNYFPNMDEYGIKDSLAVWYRIMLQSSHVSTTVVDEESDAKLISQWWATDTGVDGGDRCIFSTGDNYFNALLVPGGVPHPNDIALASSTFGVAVAADAWNGTAGNQFPAIRDLFADPKAGPALGTGSFSYPVHGGCPGPKRFCTFTRIGG